MFVAALVAFVCCRATAQVNIWDGVPGHKRVEMTPFLAPGSGNTAVVVCPGGSYFWHDITTEGYDVARWLQKNGISAFVLRYRTAMDFYGIKEGSLCGFSKDWHNLAITQVPVVTKVKNLLLTGQNNNLHGFCGVPLTAIQTCEALLGQNYVLNKINEVAPIV